MWLDCILLFPLILLGLERLVRGESGMLYVITLGLSILSNYYISIMTCIFLVIYFICLNVLEGMERPRVVGIRILRFALYSLIAGGLAASSTCLHGRCSSSKRSRASITDRASTRGR